MGAPGQVPANADTRPFRFRDECWRLGQTRAAAAPNNSYLKSTLGCLRCSFTGLLSCVVDA
jgi:hypothetical protein